MYELKLYISIYNNYQNKIDLIFIIYLLIILKINVLQRNFSECDNNNLNLLNDVIKLKYFQKKFDEKLNVMKIIRNEKNIFKFENFYHFISYIKYYETDIIHNIVDSIKIMICNLM